MTKKSNKSWQGGNVMIVAFLDLLGFSALLRMDTEVALDNMNAFNNVIKTRFIDNKCHPIAEYKKQYPNDAELHNSVEKSSVTAFSHMISYSDSLILGGTDYDLFIMQLANFVATTYINYSEPFRDSFSDINTVLNYKTAERGIDGNLLHHKASPVLFRGGISVGESVGFFEEYHIKDNELKRSSLNVTGVTYLNAVKLESFGRGPRLFCDKSVVDVVNEKTKKLIKVVDKEKGIYEIVWTIEGCEATGNSSNKWENVVNRINDKMLPAAVNLYKYYRDDHHLELQYKELLKLVCEGIVKYATDECDRAEEAINLINKKLKDELLVDQSFLNGFII